MDLETHVTDARHALAQLIQIVVLLPAPVSDDATDESMVLTRDARVKDVPGDGIV